MQEGKESTRELRELLDRASREDLDNLAKGLFKDKYENKTVREVIHELRYVGSHDVPYIFRKFNGVHYIEIARDEALSKQRED